MGWFFVDSDIGKYIVCVYVEDSNGYCYIIWKYVYSICV